jgi:ElaB/YqjD/DUF883 family membrane-anchored ribosome-binding protein
MNANEVSTAEAVDPVRMDGLIAALKVLAQDTKALVAATSDQTGQQIARARARADDSLAAALAHAGNIQDSTLARTRALGHATDVYVRAHRWEVLAASAAVGFVLGALVVRHGASETSET